MILMKIFPNEYVIYYIKFNSLTNPGWFSMIVWVVFLFFVSSGFKDPEPNNKNNSNNKEKQSVSYTESEVQESTQAVSKNFIQENSALNDIENDINNIIDEEENSYSYMSISFTILILILLIIRVTFN
jgi:hypothetical protein